MLVYDRFLEKMGDAGLFEGNHGNPASILGKPFTCIFESAIGTSKLIMATVTCLTFVDEGEGKLCLNLSVSSIDGQFIDCIQFTEKDGWRINFLTTSAFGSPSVPVNIIRKIPV